MQNRGVLGVVLKGLWFSLSMCFRAGKRTQGKFFPRSDKPSWLKFINITRNLSLSIDFLLCLQRRKRNIVSSFLLPFSFSCFGVVHSYLKPEPRAARSHTQPGGSLCARIGPLQVGEKGSLPRTKKYSQIPYRGTLLANVTITIVIVFSHA